MNGISLVVFLAVMAIGGIFCYLAALFIMEGLRRINPAWVGVVPPPLPPAPKKKTKLIPRRKIPSHLLKLAAKASATACLGWAVLGPSVGDHAQVEGIRTNLWPVWARPGNDNILSRIKYFGEEFSQNRPGKIESVPEDLWPFWMRQGNEHLLKRRSPWCGGTV